MKVTCIGCGNAFSKLLFNQSFLLEEDGRKLLIDCGSKVPMALYHHNIDVTEIDDIYISHLHADHIGGLEEMAFGRYDWAMNPKPDKAINFKNVEAPHLICEKNMMEDLWNKSLRGGLESMEGFIADIDTFFVTKPVSVDEPFEWMGWECKLIQQIHIVTGTKIMDTYGLFLSKSGHKSIFFTTDTQHYSHAQALVFLEDADVIFHDCELTPFVTNVHANYIQLAGFDEAGTKRLPDHIKSKIKLIHYQDYKVDGKKMVVKDSPYNFFRAPDSQKEHVGFIDFDWDEQAKKDGFNGFIKLGETFEF
ncbi:MAG: MBL fold metallo-hydrolase [Desulfobacterales bacterium]|nr:MBL fold metallo-hydrolase [Desulfobacterales bacterium]MCP4162216.1 MBL fold metallo-hydrolase [Deltaproteobacteria bacterium]